MKKNIIVLYHLKNFNNFFYKLINIDIKSKDENKDLLLLILLPPLFEHLLIILLYSKDTIKLKKVIIAYLLNKMKKRPNNETPQSKALFMKDRPMYKE